MVKHALQLAPHRSARGERPPRRPHPARGCHATIRPKVRRSLGYRLRGTSERGIVQGGGVGWVKHAPHSASQRPSRSPQRTRPARGCQNSHQPMCGALVREVWATWTMGAETPHPRVVFLVRCHRAKVFTLEHLRAAQAGNIADQESCAPGCPTNNTPHCVGQPGDRGVCTGTERRRVPPGGVAEAVAARTCSARSISAATKKSSALWLQQHASASSKDEPFWKFWSKRGVRPLS